MNEETVKLFDSELKVMDVLWKEGAIERSEPGFMCHALIPKEKARETETKELINKVYDGCADKLFAALLGRKRGMFLR